MHIQAYMHSHMCVNVCMYVCVVVTYVYCIMQIVCDGKNFHGFRRLAYN